MEKELWFVGHEPWRGVKILSFLDFYMAVGMDAKSSKEKFKFYLGTLYFTAMFHFISVHFITLCWGMFIIVWVISAFSVKPILDQQSLAGRLATFAFLTLTFMFLLGKIPWWNINIRIWPLRTTLRTLACIISFVGLSVSIWSRLALGPNWSATVTYREGHELIQHGPYRFVRHPMYSGFLLMIIGTVVEIGTISGLISLIICSCGTWWKLTTEEDMLSKHFPDSYQRYKSKTKIIIPFVL